MATVTHTPSDAITSAPPPPVAVPFTRRLVRGRPDDPAWVRPALIGLLAVTAVLYLWDLSSSGWANSFYAAAVQAGTKSWKAMFFGSSDAANFITVDKPPASLWVMELSARIFGLNSWSLLVPQALEGVATVGVVYAAVRRRVGAGPALLAGAVVALTPVAALMFRYDNPDALLALLLTGAAYATLRAVEGGRTRWLVLAGALIGFGFITKEMQAFLVLPALGVTYLVAGPPRLGRRIVQLLISGAALVAAAGWWVAAVQLTPAADRPYIGGSQDNSLWNVIFGYNGLGRLTGNETGSVGGGGTAGGQWGPTGWRRLFEASMGGQISWLLPAALLLLIAGLWWTRRAPRTDLTRAALLVWGGGLVVTAVVISFSQGIIHPYYTVALAPLMAATIGIGVWLAWPRLGSIAGRGVLAVAVAGSAVWSTVLLDRTPSWFPWLRVVVLVAGGGGGAVLLVLWPSLRRRSLRVLVASVALLGVLAGPAAYTADTVAQGHTGAIPSAGPASAGGFGPGGGGAGAAGFGRRGAARAPFGAGGRSSASVPSSSFRAGGFPAGGTRGSTETGTGGGGGGNLLSGGEVSATEAKALAVDASHYTWVMATVGSENASTYQLATGDPVMSIGGFNGTDPAPTLAQFERYVAEGKIHYFLAGGAPGSASGGQATTPSASAGTAGSSPGGQATTPSASAGTAGSAGSAGSTTSDASQITSWVEQHFHRQDVGGVEVYNLTDPVT